MHHSLPHRWVWETTPHRTPQVVKGDCTTAYSTGGVRETAPQLTPQVGKGDCTTAYSAGGVRVHHSLPHRWVRETAPQLTPQVGRGNATRLHHRWLGECNTAYSTDGKGECNTAYSTSG